MKRSGLSFILLNVLTGLFLVVGCATQLAGPYLGVMETGFEDPGTGACRENSADIPSEEDGMGVKDVLSFIAPLVAMPYTVVPLAITVNSGLNIVSDAVSRPFKGSPDGPEEQERNIEVVFVDRPFPED
ncbi:MAG TPA: hypothetical protein PKY89_01900 [Deltaproteobacteria bacterium]|mgnify:CR=1 FL=1|nr:hypothetical protein [Deltaproteobacteria bacterium]HPJ92635.1 hypothetical protein [Deltaproteobacteria bacterium]HPR55229.1 hypothetical protein [Deltaproteobacteria bacterium]